MKKLTFVAIALFAVACAKKGDKTDKQPDNAKVTAKEPAQQPPVAGSKTVTVTTKSPEAKAAFDLGTDLMLNARMAEAAPQFKKAVELDADFAQAHAFLGVATPGPEGATELEKATTLAAALPEAEKTWIDGFRLMRNGDEAGALAAWKKVTELAPDDWRALGQLGVVANNAGDFVTGKAMFEKVAKMKPDLAIVQNGLAYAHAGLREWDPAVAAAKKQTELLPKEPNPQDTLGEIQMMGNKLEDAEKSFMQAITIEPKFAFAWQGIAVVRGYRGDFKGAAEASNKRIAATDVRNDKVDAAIDSAWFAAAGGKPADALPLFDAIDKDPENAKVPSTAFVALDRGILLQQAGKYDDAAKAFADAMKRTESLPGQAKVMIERRQAIALLRNAALSNKPAADADKLVAVADANATTPAAKSGAAWAKGLAAWAKTGAKDAVVELSKCEPTHVTCRYDLAVAQRKAGDAAGADATEKQIGETFVRDASAVYFRSLLTKKK